jgi:hypothetical protein
MKMGTNWPVMAIWREAKSISGDIGVCRDS